MSTTIDNRVVSMEFDNKNFEQGVAETLKTLKNLDKSVNNVSNISTKGFENLGKAVGNVSFERMGNAIDRIADRFSFFGIVATTTLQKISSSIVDVGTKLARSLSIDQITAGWQKYNEKTESVQMIMNATGDSIGYVEEQLDKLMWFTDQTSYSFVDMTSNIGKFTASGVDLETATTAMEGISNWAALSGANVEKASRAMYNLSQALGVGSVKVQDWMSIENANMATTEFKEIVIETGVELGKLEKTADGLYHVIGENSSHVFNSESFRSELATGWFDADVLMSVLTYYAEFTEELYAQTEALEAIGVDSVDLTGDLISLTNSYIDLDDAASEFNHEFGDNATTTIEQFDHLTRGVVKSIEELSGSTKITTENIMDLIEVCLKGEELTGDVFTTILGGDNSADQSKTKESIEKISLAIKDISKAADVGEDKVKDFIKTLSGNDNGSLNQLVADYFNLDIEKDIEQIKVISDAVSDLGQECYDFGRKAFSAGQETKTFKDALNYAKDAVSSGWMSTFQHLFGNYEEARELWGHLSNTLYELFVTGGEARNELLESANSSAWDQLSDRLATTGVDADKFKNILIDVAKEHGIAIDQMIEDEGSFEATLANGWLTSPMIIEGLKRIKTNLKDYALDTHDSAMTLDSAMQVVQDILIGKYGNGMGKGGARYEALTALGYDAEKMQQLADKYVGYGKLTEEDVSGIIDPLGTAASLTEEELEKLIAEAEDSNKPLSELIGDMSKINANDAFTKGLWNTMDALVAMVDLVRSAWRDIFPSVTADTIRELAIRFQVFTGNIADFFTNSNMLKGVLKGIFSIIRIGLTIIKAAGQFIKPFLTLVKIIGTELGRIFGVLGNVISGVVTSTNGLSPLVTICSGLANVLTIIFETGSKMIETVINPLIGGALEKLRTKLSSAGEKLAAFNEKVSDSEWQTETANKILNKFIDIVNKIVYLNVGDLMLKLGFSQETVDKVTEKMNAIKDAITKPFATIKRNVVELINDIKSVFKGDITFVDFVEKWWGKITSKLNSIKEKVKTKASEIWASITSGVESMNIDGTIQAQADKIKGKIVEIFSKVFEKIGNLGNGAFGFLGKVVTGLKNGLGSLGTILMTLAGAFFLLNSGRAMGWLTQIGKFMRQLKGYQKALKIQKWAESFKTMGVGILEIAAAIGVVVALIQWLGSTPIEVVSSGFNYLVNILIRIGGLFLLFSVILSRIKFGKTVKDFGTGVLSLGIGLAAITLSIKKFSKLFMSDDPEANKKNIYAAIAVVGALIILAAVVAGLSHALNSKANFKKLGAVVLSLTASLLIAVLAIRGLAKTIDKRGNADVWIAIGAFAVISGLMVAYNALISKSNKIRSTHGTGLLIAISSILAALLVIQILTAMIKLNKSDLTPLLGAIGIFASIGLIIAGYNKSLSKNKLELKSVGAFTLSIANLIGVFSAITYTITKFKTLSVGWGDLGRVGSVLAASLVSVWAIFALCKKYSGTSGIGNASDILKLILTLAPLLILVSSIAALALVLKKNDITWKEMGPSLIIFGSAFAALIAMSLILKKAGSSGPSGAIGGVLEFVGIFLLVVLAIAGTAALIAGAGWVVGKAFQSLGEGFNQMKVAIDNLSSIDKKDVSKASEALTTLFSGIIPSGTGFQDIIALLVLPRAIKSIAGLVETLPSLTEPLADLGSRYDDVVSGVNALNYLMTNFDNGSISVMFNNLFGQNSAMAEASGYISTTIGNIQTVIDGLTSLSDFTTVDIDTSINNITHILSEMQFKGDLSNWSNVENASLNLIGFLDVADALVQSVVNFNPEIDGKKLNKKMRSIVDFINNVFGHEIKIKNESNLDVLPAAAQSFVDFGSYIDDLKTTIDKINEIDENNLNKAINIAQKLFGKGTESDPSLAMIASEASNITGENNIFSAAEKGVSRVIEGAVDKVESTANTVSTAFGVIEGINDLGDGSIAEGFKYIEDELTGVVRIFKDDGTEIKSEVLNGIAETFSGWKSGIQNAVSGTAQTASELISGEWFKSVSESIDSKFEEAGGISGIIAECGGDIKAAGAQVGAWFNDLLAPIISDNGIIDPSMLIGENRIEGADTLISTMAGWLNTSVDEIKTMISNGTINFSAAGEKAGDLFGGKFSEIVGKVVTGEMSGNDVISQYGTEAWNKIKNDILGGENGFMGDFLGGDWKEMLSGAGIDISQLGDEFMSGLSSVAQSGKQLANEFVEGFKSNDVVVKITEGTTSLVSAAVSGIKEAVNNISTSGLSPLINFDFSTLFTAEEGAWQGYGRKLLDGLSLGLTSEDSTAGAISAAQGIAMLITETLESECHPVITPVIDTSQFPTSYGDFSNQTAMHLASSISRTTQENQNGVQNDTVTTVTLDSSSLSGILSAIGETKEPSQFTINFTGDLAQLAAALYPFITDESGRRGPSLVNK